jgi:hypothetical protein
MIRVYEVRFTWADAIMDTVVQIHAGTRRAATRRARAHLRHEGMDKSKIDAAFTRTTYLRPEERSVLG